MRTLVPLTLLFLLAHPAAAGERGPAREPYNAGGIVRSFELTSPDGDQRVEGLLLHELAPNGSVQRHLLELSDKRRLILTVTTDGPRGTLTTELRDDESGWWASLEVDRGFRGLDLAQLNAKDGAKGGEAQLTLRSSGGVSFEHPVHCGKSEMRVQDLLDAFQSSAASGRLGTSIPTEVALSVAQLDTMVVRRPGLDEPSGLYIYRDLVDVLMVALGQPPTEDPSPWRMEMGPMDLHLTIVDPEQLELVSRFRSLENTTPLSDHRVADVVDGGKKPQN